ncbi:MAG: hypothetical protein ACRETD_05285 [Steroidobacteraceae bacterium]
MGLKVQPTTGLTRPLTIVDPFKVDVKHLTRPEYDRVAQLCEGKDAEEQASIRSAAFIAGWSEFTPAAAKKIGIAVADDQPVGPKGEIAFDADTARDVWRLAHDGLFAAKISLFSLRMLEAIEVEKELRKNVSGGSYPTSTTP